jgi:DNA-binding NarL/FixJ family response regulator
MRGVVRKSDEPATVLRAIRRVHEGEIWIDRAAMRRILERVSRRTQVTATDRDRERIASLTARERQTIKAVVEHVSLPCKIVADRLHISEHTLRNHLTSIYAKLELRSRAGLYAFATRTDLRADCDDFPLPAPASTGTIPSRDFGHQDSAWHQ